MLRSVSIEPKNESYLASYRLTSLSFEADQLPYPSLKPVWTAMRMGEFSSAISLARTSLGERRIFPAAERAALEVAIAEAERRTGATDSAKRMAGRSLDLFPAQFSAHRILLSILASRKDYMAAYLHLANLETPADSPAWDESFDYQQIQIALAAWSWQLGEWDQVADHLENAFPMGLEEMPPEIREDWFRLSLYRDLPDDAAAAAALMIDQKPVENADQILQTIVQSGWTRQALPLYRAFYHKQPENQLLRRRLVALCIKEGEIEEARTLTIPGALRLAA